AGAMRLALLAAGCAWSGAALLLARLRWCARPRLVERLQPYVPAAGTGAPGRAALWSGESFREVIGPLAGQLGDCLARLLGPSDPLAVRLARLHLPTDVTAFRTRQLGHAGAGLLGAVLLTS